MQYSDHIIAPNQAIIGKEGLLRDSRTANQIYPISKESTRNFWSYQQQAASNLRYHEN
jgi:hypothetical protein